MRLSLKSVKLFMVLATLAGSLFAFTPGASAHKNTGSVSVVNGTVTWPAGTKPDFNITTPGGRDVTLDGDLSLDLRAHGIGTNQLNGCRLKGGNSGEGLPVGHAGKPATLTPPELYNNHDLCFSFAGLDFATVGLWDGLNHKTLLSCSSTGTSTASGNNKGDTPKDGAEEDPTQTEALGTTFGSFYGEFGCDGAPIDDVFQYVPSADGHFHGISLAGGLEIGFLGEVHCTTPDPGQPCPLEHPANRTNPDYWNAQGAPIDPDTGAPLDVKDRNKSRVKHTLACKGNVAPLEWTYKHLDLGDNPAQDAALGGDAIETAVVTLECVIG